MDSGQLQRQYKEHLSDFKEWSQKEHCQEYILYASNIGICVCIDETSLSNGELFTVLTNRDAKTGKKCLIAMIRGTKCDNISKILCKIPVSLRNKVKEVTVDMAANMHQVIKKCFPQAEAVVDRFHVQKLAIDGLQELRITRRWEAINAENKAIAVAKENNRPYIPMEFSNGDTPKQLLARSRYLLFKSREKWSESQKERASILFREYPEIEKAYNLCHQLRCIFNQKQDKDVARGKLALWYNMADDFLLDTKDFKFRAKNDLSKIRSNPFHSVINSIKTYSEKILNFFNNRSTNAAAECFNAKLKAFRADLRGVSDLSFFIYRVANIYAR